jgi:hypothetical protein
VKKNVPLLTELFSLFRMKFYTHDAPTALSLKREKGSVHGTKKSSVSLRSANRTDSSRGELANRLNTGEPLAPQTWQAPDAPGQAN